MPYHILLVDKPSHEELRLSTRVVHLEYMIAHKHWVLFGGPIKTDDGENTVGSVIVLNVDTREEVDEFLNNEPYFKAGLFESVIARRISVMVPEASPGFLEAELARQKS